MEYDNNRPFSSEGAAQERKRKHALGKGVIIGVVATLLVVILALSCVFMGLIRSGNLHIGIDGRIYVQDVGTSDNEGIGTKVEGKLNALDSLLGDGFYFDDVDDEKAADNIFKAYLKEIVVIIFNSIYSCKCAGYIFSTFIGVRFIVYHISENVFEGNKVGIFT